MPDDSDRALTCISCGRYPGEQDECDYCGAEGAGVSMLRICRQWSGVAVVVGLALLLIAGVREPRHLYADQISAKMNNAFVALSGRIASHPYVGSNDGKVEYVSFLLNDGSGLVRVALNGACALEFAASRAAKEGQRIEVRGRLSIKAGSPPRLYVRATKRDVGWKLLTY